MIRNSLYNSYLPEAQKGKKQKEIKEGIYNISTNRRYSYLYRNGKWYQTEKENVDKPDPNWREVYTGSSFDESLTNYANKLGKKKNVDVSIFKSGIPSNFKEIEEKGLTATDLGETKKPITENVLSNPIVYSPSLDNEVYVSPEGTVVPLSDLTYGINSIIPSRNTLLVDTPTPVEEQKILDLGNNTYVYKDGDNWYSGDSGNRIYDPKVTTQFNKLFDIQKSQLPITKPEVASVSPTIINNYTYNTENNRWYDKDNKEINDPVLISELQSKKEKKNPLEDFIDLLVNKKADNISPSLRTIDKKEDLDTYIDPNKLRFTKEYLGNLDKEIEYSPSNRVVARTPKEKKERRGRDFSFEFPDLSGAFTRRTKSKPDQKLTPAELQEYTVEDIYNPNNFATLDVIKGENISNLPSTYIPESVIPTMQSQYPIVLKEDPNAPVRIIRREIDVEAPGGMGLTGFIHKPRQMKNKFQKRYGGELTDDDFDYTLDVDTNELIEYLKGGRLPKAQIGKDAKDILSVFNQINNLEEDTNPYLVQENKIKNITDTPLFATYNFNSPNILGKQPQSQQPEVSQSNVYKMPEVVENLPSVDVTGVKITPPKLYTPTVTNVPGLGNVADRYQYEDSLNYKYNPRRLYKPSNQLGIASMLGPIAYNIGKGWGEEPEYVKTVVTPTPIIDTTMGPNYLAVDESLARIRDAVNEQAGTGSRRLNTLIGAYMQGAKQKGEIARVAEANRLQARKERNLEEKRQQAMFDTAMQQNKAAELAAKVTQEGFREKTVEQINKYIQEFAQGLDSEQKERLKIQAANQLVKDYELIYNQSTGEAKYKHIPSGTYMTQDAYTKMLTDSVNKMNADALAKAKEKEASTNESIKAKEEQDKAKSTATNTNTTTQANKFGGWIKENQQFKKKRNRLYY